MVLGRESATLPLPLRQQTFGDSVALMSWVQPSFEKTKPFKRMDGFRRSWWDCQAFPDGIRALLKNPRKTLRGMTLQFRPSVLVRAQNHCLDFHWQTPVQRYAVTCWDFGCIFGAGQHTNRPQRPNKNDSETATIQQSSNPKRAAISPVIKGTEGNCNCLTYPAQVTGQFYQKTNSASTWQVVNLLAIKWGENLIAG